MHRERAIQIMDKILTNYASWIIKENVEKEVLEAVKYIRENLK